MSMGQSLSLTGEPRGGAELSIRKPYFRPQFAPYIIYFFRMGAFASQKGLRCSASREAALHVSLANNIEGQTTRFSHCQHLLFSLTTHLFTHGHCPAHQFTSHS